MPDTLRDTFPIYLWVDSSHMKYNLGSVWMHRGSSSIVTVPEDVPPARIYFFELLV